MDYCKKVLFRNSIKEQSSVDILVEKAMDHCSISIMQFFSFSSGFKNSTDSKYPKLILSAFANLITHYYNKLEGLSSLNENLQSISTDEDFL